jgi:hypothetical protein
MLGVIQFIIHYGLHFLYPIAVAYYAYRVDWQKVYLVLLATMLIDLDHLFANPIFVANRCSIGFHGLHRLELIPIYFALLFIPKWPRIIGLGICMHLLTDWLDCMMMGL